MGNTTVIGATAREYVYGPTGRMVQSKQNGTVSANYRYNGRGEQVRRDTPASSTRFVYDEAGQLLGQYFGNGNPLQQYIWLDAQPVGVIAHGQLYAVQGDHLGTPRTIIDQQRDVAIWSWPLNAEAFGTNTPDTDPDGDGSAFVYDLRFPGQRYDSASGLNYNYFRDYEAGTGRYVESDPIGFDGGINTYAYAYSTPLLAVDPMGLVGLFGRCPSGTIKTCVYFPAPRCGCTSNPPNSRNKCVTGDCAFFPPDTNCACTLDCFKRLKQERVACMLLRGSGACSALASIKCGQECKGKCDPCS